MQPLVNETVYIRLRGEREVRGKLQAFDQHLNMLLLDAEETQWADARRAKKLSSRAVEM